MGEGSYVQIKSLFMCFETRLVFTKKPNLSLEKTSLRLEKTSLKLEKLLKRDQSQST